MCSFLYSWCFVDEKVDDIVCSICMDTIRDNHGKVKPRCGHWMCISCYSTLLLQHQNNAVLNKQDVYRVLCSICRIQVVTRVMYYVMT